MLNSTVGLLRINHIIDLRRTYSYPEGGVLYRIYYYEE